MADWGKFWLCCLRWAFWRWEKGGEAVLTNAVPLVLSLFSWLFALLGLAGISKAVHDTNPLWLSALAPVTAMTLFVAPYRLWKKEADEVLAYETPVLTMWHEDLESPNPFVHHFPQGDELFRIAIKGPKGKTVEDVQVSLKQFEPQGAEFLPQALNSMSRDFNRATPPTFTLNPGVTTFIDVIRWVPEFKEREDTSLKAPRPVYVIMYFRHDLRNVIEHNKYRFTLIAEGKDVPPSEQDFEVVFDAENKPIFRQLSVSSI